MTRWLCLAAMLLWAAPAAAIEVKCDGGTWYGSDIRDCPCCEVCRDGTWRADGDEPCPTFNEAAPKAVSRSEKYEALYQDRERPLSSRIFSIVGDLITLAAVLGLYFLPFGLAKYRKHHQADAILLTNLFLGWTGLGWLVALIWAATATKGKKA